MKLIIARSQEMLMDVSFNLVAKDAVRIKADVLALKYAQANYGLDAVVSDTLIEGGPDPSLLRPRPGGFRLVESVNGIAADKILLRSSNNQLHPHNMRNFGFLSA